MTNLLLIEVSSLIFRCYFAYPPLQRRRDGAHVGAVAGVTGMLWRMLTRGAHGDLRGMPTHVGVVFDSPQRTFRHDLLPSYKGNRPPRLPELLSQFDLVRQAVRAFGLQPLEQPGYEADDLIASYAEANGAGTTVIVSADKDLMQLVSPSVLMVDDMNDRLVGAREVEEKFGVRPDQIVDYLALVGDSVDNIPGVPAVGPKTATALLARYGDMEGILTAVGEVRPARISHNLHVSASQARLARKLVTLARDIELTTPLADLAWPGAIETGPIIEFCDEMEFVSLRRKIERALQEAA
jgi:DNA polymerase-1